MKEEKTLEVGLTVRWTERASASSPGCPSNGGVTLEVNCEQYQAHNFSRGEYKNL